MAKVNVDKRKSWVEEKKCSVMKACDGALPRLPSIHFHILFPGYSFSAGWDMTVDLLFISLEVIAPSRLWLL